MIAASSSAAPLPDGGVDSDSLLGGVTLNPLVPILGPLQRHLGRVLIYERAVQRVLLWEVRVVVQPSDPHASDPHPSDPHPSDPHASDPKPFGGVLLRRADRVLLSGSQWASLRNPSRPGSPVGIPAESISPARPQDGMVTAWLCVSLAVCTVLLALVPWGVVLHYGLRALGGLALGPHMHLVGRWLERRKAKARREEEEYAAANRAGREAILKVHRVRIGDEARKKVTAAAKRHAGRSASERQVAAFLNDDSRFNLAVVPTRTSGRHKHRSEPDPSRSRAYPLPAAAAPPTSSPHEASMEMGH